MKKCVFTKNALNFSIFGLQFLENFLEFFEEFLGSIMFIKKILEKIKHLNLMRQYRILRINTPAGVWVHVSVLVPDLSLL